MGAGKASLTHRPTSLTRVVTKLNHRGGNSRLRRSPKFVMVSGVSGPGFFISFVSVALVPSQTSKRRSGLPRFNIIVSLIDQFPFMKQNAALTVIDLSPMTCATG